MNRNELLEILKPAFVETFENDFEDFEHSPEEAEDHIEMLTVIKNATDLSEIAEVCMGKAWDIAMFVGLILQTLGFDDTDVNTTWLTEHCYGWDT